MSKNLVQSYGMVVCLVSSLTLMFVLIFTGSSVIDLVLTEYKHSDVLTKFNSREQYMASKNLEERKKIESLSDTEIEEKMYLEKKHYIESKKALAISNMTSSISWIVVCSMFFIIHWLLYTYENRKVID